MELILLPLLTFVFNFAPSTLFFLQNMALQRKKGSHNPFAFKAKSGKKTSGKRVGKSKAHKANNQLNRRVK